MNQADGPTIAIVQGSAARLAEALSRLASQENGSEWGGLLWGRRLCREVVWVAAMTPGIGSASPVEFTITPASYAAGARLLEEAGFPAGLDEVGLWHSHPGYGAFLSHQDEATFDGCFPRPEMLSIVIDPLRNERAVFAKSPAGARAIAGLRYEGERLGRVPELDAKFIWKTRNGGTP